MKIWAEQEQCRGGHQSGATARGEGGNVDRKEEEEEERKELARSRSRQIFLILTLCVLAKGKEGRRGMALAIDGMSYILHTAPRQADIHTHMHMFGWRWRETRDERRDRFSRNDATSCRMAPRIKYKERKEIPKYFIKSKAAEKKSEKKWLVGISRASTVNAAWRVCLFSLCWVSSRPSATSARRDAQHSSESTVTSSPFFLAIYNLLPCPFELWLMLLARQLAFHLLLLLLLLLHWLSRLLFHLRRLRRLLLLFRVVHHHLTRWRCWSSYFFLISTYTLKG